MNNLIKFDRVVSVNSELQGHEAKHLLEMNVDVNHSWLCSRGCDKAVAILKMERATVVNKVDIGNAHSAFVEVLVGRASDAFDQFHTLIPTSTFMTPNESKTGTNKNQVRFFTCADFDQSAVGKQWDLIKIVCSQPFDKNASFGLCFVKVHGEAPPMLQLKPPSDTTIAVGSFFRKRKEESNEEQKTLSISEKIREAGKPAALAKHTPMSSSKLKPQTPARYSSSKNKEDSETDNRRNRGFGLDEPSPKKIRVDDSKIERIETERSKDDKKPQEERIVDERKRNESKHPERRTETDRKKDERKPQSEKKNQKEDRRNVTEKEKKREPQDEPSARKKIPCEGGESSKKKREASDNKERYSRKEKGTPPRPHRKRKPFHRLLEDVVFVLSGYQNPERANYRSHALSMGAKYNQDWTDRCTHLIAAYINTPKCNQVRGTGKIVSKEWVERCYRDKKRYPWRRFALDKTEQRQPESEDEIDAERDSPERDRELPSSSSAPHSTSNITAESENQASWGRPDESYDAPTDDEDDDASLIPALPDFFRAQTFHVDDSIADKPLLERYIIAYNGTLTDSLEGEVNFFVTLQRGPVVSHLLKNTTKCKAVSPTWIQSINCAQKFIPAENFIID